MRATASVRSPGVTLSRTPSTASQTSPGVRPPSTSEAASRRGGVPERRARKSAHSSLVPFRPCRPPELANAHLGVASDLAFVGVRDLGLDTATITPAASGAVAVNIAAAAAQDGAGNPSVAAVQFSIVADLTPGPALPVIGAIALALLLLVGGARRRTAS